MPSVGFSENNDGENRVPNGETAFFQLRDPCPKERRRNNFLISLRMRYDLVAA